MWSNSIIPKIKMNEKIEVIAQNSNDIKRTRAYKALSTLSNWMDRYYIDHILGIIPGGWGDTVSAVMMLPFIGFSLLVVRSVPLTLAIVYNVLKDIVIGLIPFFVGDILDVFSHSYTRNMRLISGFVEKDKTIIREVNRKAWAFAVAIVLCIVAIVLLVRLTVMLFSMLFHWIG